MALARMSTYLTLVESPYSCKNQTALIHTFFHQRAQDRRHTFRVQGYNSSVLATLFTSPLLHFQHSRAHFGPGATLGTGPRNHVLLRTHVGNGSF